ncbi:unnamed protein product, partial [Laminaria digitata]
VVVSGCDHGIGNKCYCKESQRARVHRDRGMPHSRRRAQTARRGRRYQGREMRHHQDGRRGAPGVYRGEGVQWETARSRQQCRDSQRRPGALRSSGDVGGSRRGQSPRDYEDDQDVPPPSRRNAGSRVVFVSSIAGLCPMWGGSSYSASKFGVKGYARVLRDELHVFDVQVSIVTPGPTDTNMVQHYLQSTRENFEACPEGIKNMFGLDYADRYCEKNEITMRRVPMDDASVPTGYICKAVGSMKCGDRYYSGLMAKTVVRIAAIFP